MTLYKIRTFIVKRSPLERINVINHTPVFPSSDPSPTLWRRLLRSTGTKLDSLENILDDIARRSAASAEANRLREQNAELEGYLRAHGAAQLPLPRFALGGLTSNIVDGNYRSNRRNAIYGSIGSEPLCERMFEPRYVNNIAEVKTDNTMAHAAALPKIALPTADPGTFSGRKSQNVKSYMENYEAAGEANRWNGELKKQYLPFYLRDTARKWYNGYKIEVNTHTATWQEIKEALEEAFDNAEYKELLEIKLLNRRRLEGERLESHIYDVLDMCRQIDETMPDKLKIRHVRRGLNSW